jgi:PAS domain S-box-containing protein
MLDLKFLSSAIQDAPNAISFVMVLDSQGQIRYVSPSLERAMGYPLPELIDRQLAGLIHPEDLTAVNHMLEVAGREAGLPTYAEFRFRHKDGSWRYLEAVCQVMMEGGQPYAVLNAHDFTFRKRIEEELRASKEQLQMITDNMSDLVTLIDLQGMRQSVSPSYTRILGYKQEDLIGRPIASLIHPEDVDKVNAVIARAAETGHFETVEFRTRHADGHYIWQEAIGKALFDERGATAGGVITSRDITERMRAQEKIERQVQRLNALRSIDIAISASFNLRLTLNVLLTQVTTQLNVDAADILLLNPHLQMLEFAAKQGFHTSALERTRLRLGEGYGGLAALERRLISVPELGSTRADLTKYLERSGEHFESYYAVPLVARGEVRGVMEVFHRTLLAPDREWLDFLETVANQAAIAIEDLSLFEALQRSNTELTAAYDSTIEGWSRALDLRDKETEGHTLRVTEMTLRLARSLGIPEEELAHIRRGALLHDICKMGVPDGIFLKPGPLTEEEWTIMRKHPVYAYELLSPVAFLRPALEILYCHHEKWDGTGYPRGLKGEKIPLSARIFAVVDVWDALRSDRPYRKAWSEEQVHDYILAQREKHFDPKVVGAFLELLHES